MQTLQREETIHVAGGYTEPIYALPPKPVPPDPQWAPPEIVEVMKP
jgi:hypothetical protein